MILSLQQGLAQDGFKVSLVKLCQWFEMPRRTVYYRSVKAAPKVQDHLTCPLQPYQSVGERSRGLQVN